MKRHWTRFGMSGVCLPIVVAALVAGCLARPVAAADGLVYIPDDALGYVVINNLGEFDAKLAALAKKFNAPLGSPLTMLKLTANIGEGLDEKRDLVVALVPGEPGGFPRPVIAAPVSDYAKFIGQFDGADAAAKTTEISVMGQKIAATSAGKYAVLALADDKELLAKAAARTSADSVVPGAQRKWIEAQDFALVVRRSGIEMGMEFAVQGMEQARGAFEAAAAGGPQAAQMGAALDMYKELFQGIRDGVSQLSVSLRADEKQNWFITVRADALNPDDLNSIASEADKSKSDSLAGLPAGSYIFVGGGPMPETLAQLSSKWGMQFMQANPALYGLDENSEGMKKLLDASAAASKGIQAMSMVMQSGDKGEPIYGNFYIVTKVADSTKYLADYGKMMVEWQALGSKTKGAPQMKWETKTAEIAGIKGFEFTVDMKSAFEAGNVPAQGQPMMSSMMEAMFGPEGKMRTYVLPVDEHLILSATASPEKIAKWVEEAKTRKAGLEGDGDIAHTRRLQSENAQWLGYLSPSGIVSVAKRVLVPLVPQAPPIPEFPSSPPIGLSAEARDGRVELQVVIPAATLDAVRDFIDEIMAPQF